MHRCQEVVFLVVEHVVVHGHARRHEFGYAPLHHLVHLGQPPLAFHLLPLLLRVFQLVAYGHAPARPDEFGQVGVECVVGKAGHFRFAAESAVVAFGERNAQDVGRNDGVMTVGLVEVAATKQQDGVGMLVLHREKLFHHGCQTLVILSHSLLK